MAFKIQPHTRIQEWVALEKGYFSDEGLEYELEKSFVGAFRNPDLDGPSMPVTEMLEGAFEDMDNYGEDRREDIGFMKLLADAK
jgi:hypothetical protein